MNAQKLINSKQDYLHISNILSNNTHSFNEKFGGKTQHI